MIEALAKATNDKEQALVEMGTKHHNIMIGLEKEIEKALSKGKNVMRALMKERSPEENFSKWEEFVKPFIKNEDE